MTVKNHLEPSETSARARSKVTPNNALNKIRDKILFVGIVMISFVMVLFVFFPGKTKARNEAESLSESSAKATLSQNLALIAQMKKEADTHYSGAKIDRNSIPTRPPILRDHKETSATPSQEILARMNASSSFSLETTKLTSVESVTSNSKAHVTLTGNNANAQFVNDQDDIVSVSAKRIPHPDYTVPAGEFIPATLEVAMNSELPGMVRAITTRDIYSLSGRNCLIPSGSTLVGQFNAGVVEGQSRLLVVWNRVQMHDGVIVTLNSPGTDALGRSGMGADMIDRHFFERFGSSALLSILGGATAISGVGNQDQYNSKAQFRMGIASSLQEASSQSLGQNIAIKPTMYINQGALINVFVAHDLDFNEVGVAKIAHNPRIQLMASRSKGNGTWKQ